MNGQIVKRGRYAIVRDASASENVCLVMQQGEYANRIIYDDNYNGQKEFFQVTNDKLSFVSGCFAFDAGSFSDYERISDGNF